MKTTIQFNRQDYNYDPSKQHLMFWCDLEDTSGDITRFPYDILHQAEDGELTLRLRGGSVYPEFAVFYNDPDYGWTWATLYQDGDMQFSRRMHDLFSTGVKIVKNPIHLPKHMAISEDGRLFILDGVHDNEGTRFTILWTDTLRSPESHAYPLDLADMTSLLTWMGLWSNCFTIDDDLIRDCFYEYCDDIPVSLLAEHLPLSKLISH